MSKESSKRWYDKNKERHKDMVMARRKANPEKQREYNRKHDEKYRQQRRDAALIRARRNLPIPSRPMPTACEIIGCGRPAKHLDHDHATGLFRGWLCAQCNMALGLLGDNADRIYGLINYISSNK